MRGVLFSFFLVTLFFSCDTSMNDVISTEDLLIGKWQLESYTENEETPNTISSCELLKTLTFSNNELLIDTYVESFGGISCILKDSQSSNYYLKENTIKTSYLDLIIDKITVSELYLKILITENDETVTLKEKYTKIN